MRNILSALGVVLLGASLAFTQSSSSRPLSAFDQQLIDQEKQFLPSGETTNQAVLERAVADNFQGIGNNGDFYDKGELIESVAEMRKDARAYDFHVVKLNADAAIVTYHLIVPEEHPRYRHMADTWARIDGRWQLKFRQITPNIWSANDLD
jgi:hypothetical protein